MKHPVYFREAVSLIAFGSADPESMECGPSLEPKKKGL